MDFLTSDMMASESISQSGLIDKLRNFKVGEQPSYYTPKELYVAHPLGRKIIETPLKVILSAHRGYRFSDDAAVDKQLNKRFKEVWDENSFGQTLFNAGVVKRLYGAAAVVLNTYHAGKLCKTDSYFTQKQLLTRKVCLTVLDPLNFAGRSSLTNQDIFSSKYGKPPTELVIDNRRYPQHNFRFLLNSSPLFLMWITSAYGFSGASSFCPIIYPLCSYLETERASRMLSLKAGVIVARTQQASVAPTQLDIDAQAERANIVKQAQTNNVIAITEGESIESLNLQHTVESLQGARDIDLKDIAAGSGVPYSLLVDERIGGALSSGDADLEMLLRNFQSEADQLEPLRSWMERLTCKLAFDREFLDQFGLRFDDVMSLFEVIQQPLRTSKGEAELAKAGSEQAQEPEEPLDL